MERRSCKRWQVDLPARFNLGDTGSEETVLKDVNAKGARFICPQEISSDLQKDLLVKFRLNLEEVEAQAQIIWQEKGLFAEAEAFVGGLRFIKIRDLDKKKIFDYVFNKFPRQVTNAWWRDSTVKGEPEK